MESEARCHVKAKTENVKKICGCVKWKTCEHPWYLDFYRKGFKRIRDNHDLVIGRHPADYAEAKLEARRAIVAKLDGRDPKGLVPSDDPTLAMLLEEYDAEKPRRDRWQIGRIVGAQIAEPRSARCAPAASPPIR